MSCVKIVVGAFLNAGKTGNSAFCPNRGELLVAPRKKLVGVALVAYIPDNSIVRAVKDAVKGNRKLNNAKVACKMPSVLSNNLNYFGSDFLCKGSEFLFWNFFQILR